VIQAIRNIVVQKGYIHPSLKLQATAIANHGRLWEDVEFVNEMREDLGLPPVSAVDLDEVAKILEYTKVKDLLTAERGEDEDCN
jgi:heterodisulfide reductase subunit C